MDPFQTRLRFVSSLHRINASLPTIQKSLSFIVDHASHMHTELWDCIIDEFRTSSINRRINLLFLIDAIFTDDTLTPTIRALFRKYLERDLYTLIDLAVPEGRWDALLNVPAVSKIVAAWKARFVLDRGVLEDLEVWLDVRKTALYALSPASRSVTVLPPNEMQRRIEEDRERHKRLRERSWILPPTAFSHQSLFGVRPEQLDPTYAAAPAEQNGDAEADRIWTTQDLDFSQMWEETSDFNDDDVDDIVENEKLGWIHQPSPPPPAAVAPAPAQTPTYPSPQSAPVAPAQRQPPRAPASMRFAQQHS
ncbi:uncharacterized protein SRS1_10125 [Sporisorium reilianum f. sp. reilianum]|uniref:CID domain-containing protein n=1 Tax=Sporisorium reilianum f. sp. reilianum TaxID=72559 RepID=A0A2N8U709_9BASI|nr:uncharacterized protein SRS1_10125 [Sporisorium reilianum f. sp. reilianum]